MTSTVKSLTWILGIIFILLSVAGFMNNPALGIFEVDSVHNIIHLLSGVIALAAVASGESYARLFLIIFGIVYGVVAIIGFIDGNDILGLFVVNQADNYLHTGIALACIAVGFGGSRR